MGHAKWKILWGMYGVCDEACAITFPHHISHFPFAIEHPEGLSDPGGILRFVVRLERRVLVLDRAPPPLVVAVPCDGLGQPFVERHLRPPPERLQFRRV